jgi:hypothetical protein
MLRSCLTVVFAAALFAAGPVSAAPEVAPPEDFADAGAVADSLKSMHAYIEDRLEATGSWQARRAEGVCRDALRRLEDRRTALAYDAGDGEAIWRDCHEGYVEVD